MQVFLVVILGASIGSFINVVAWRLPRDESIIHTRSHCPQCMEGINWYDNIPIVSWFILKGKCRKCKSNINIRYPSIEFLCSTLCLLCFLHQPPYLGPESHLSYVIAGWLLVSVLIPLSLIDLDHLWIPESLCNVGLLFGFLMIPILSINQVGALTWEVLSDQLLGLSIGYLTFRVVGYIAKKVFGKPALGIGDAKLTAVLGSWLGLQGIGLTIFLTFILSGCFAIIGLITRKLRRGEAFPLGPFLSIAGFLVWILGKQFWIENIF